MGVGSVLVPSLSWKHHTGKNKTRLGSTQGTAQHCLFSSRFLLRQSQEEQVLLSAWCLQRCSRRVLPLSRSQTPESHDLKTCAILVHPACCHPLLMLSSLSSRTAALSSLVPLSLLPLQLSFQWSLFLLKKGLKRLPNTFKHSVSLPQHSQRTPVPGRASFLS